MTNYDFLMRADFVPVRVPGQNREGIVQHILKELVKLQHHIKALNDLEDIQAPVWLQAQAVINERQWYADLRNAAAFLIELGLDDRAIAQALDTTPKSIALLRNQP